MRLINQSLSLIKKSSCLFKSNKQTASITKSMTSLTQKSLNDLNNETVKKGLQEAFDFFSTQKGKSSQLRLIQIDDIIHKYTQCSDDTLKKDLKTGFKWLSKENKKTHGETLDLLENSLDAFNSAGGLYSPLYNVNANIGISFEDKIINSIAEFCSKFKNSRINKKYKHLDFKEHGYSTPRQLYRTMKREYKPLDTNSIAFEKFAKNSPLEQFILKYKDEQPELIEYLYKNSYLSELEQPKLKNFCEKINQKFGIKIFDYTFYKFNEKSAYIIEKELEMFHRALKPKDKLVDILKISDLDMMYKFGSASGYCNASKDLISMTTWKTNNTFRHELIHAADKKMLKFYSKTKLADPKLEEDLIKSGAPEYLIKYAKTNLSEKKAVLGQFYTPKYSKETKEFMVKNGLPKEILKLREIDFYDYIVNSKKWDKNSINTIKQLRAKLGGRIPQNIFDRILSNGLNSSKEALLLLKTKKHVNPKLFTEILDYQTNILEKKHYIAELKIDINNAKKMLLNPQKASWAEEIKQGIVEMTSELKIINEDLMFTEDLLKQTLSKC